MLDPSLQYDLEDLLVAEATLRTAAKMGGKLGDPSLLDVLYRRGRVRRELGRYDEALIDFRTVLDGMAIFLGKDADYRPPAYLSRANVYLETAHVHRLQRNHDVASYTLDLAEAEAEKEADYRNWSDIRLERARIAISQNELLAASVQLEKAEAMLAASVLDADEALILAERAVIASRRGERDEAVEILQRALDEVSSGSLMAAELELMMGDEKWMLDRQAAALWNYHRAEKVLAQVVEDKGPARAEVKLEVVRHRLSYGREQRKTLSRTLMDRLRGHVQEIDGAGIVATILELAHMAMLYDDYGRIKAVLESEEWNAALAILAHHMTQLAEAAELDSARYEIDYEDLTEQLSEFDQDLLADYLL